MLEIWERQQREGKPLTITDPEMTRFWMPVDAAVDLVLLALERGRGGEIFIPKHVERGTEQQVEGRSSSAEASE